MNIAPLTIWTIGHSTRTIEEFLGQAALKSLFKEDFGNFCVESLEQAYSIARQLRQTFDTLFKEWRART